MYSRIAVGIALQNQARLQLDPATMVWSFRWNCASKSSTVTTPFIEILPQYQLELRFKIKHGYNIRSKYSNKIRVGIALQNQARLQPVKCVGY